MYEWYSTTFSFNVVRDKSFYNNCDVKMELQLLRNILTKLEVLLKKLFQASMSMLFPLCK